MSGPTLVQSISSAWNGSLTASPALTLTGVAPGNSLILVASHQAFDNANPTFTISDAQASYTQDLFQQQVSKLAVVVASLTNANAGSHTCAVTPSAGAAASSFGSVILMEWTPLTFDTSVFANNGTVSSTTHPQTTATGTLGSAADVAFVALCAQNSIAGGTFPPTGGTGTYTSLFSSTGGGTDGDYQILTTNAAVSAAWGTITASNWVAGLAAYKVAAQPVSLTPTVGAPALTGTAATVIPGSVNLITPFTAQRKGLWLPERRVVAPHRKIILPPWRRAA